MLTVTVAGVGLTLTPTGASEVRKGLGLEAASEREEARPNLIFRLNRDPDAHLHALSPLAFLVVIKPESLS